MTLNSFVNIYNKFSEKPIHCASALWILISLAELQRGYQSLQKMIRRDGRDSITARNTTWLITWFLLKRQTNIKNIFLHNNEIKITLYLVQN